MWKKQKGENIIIKGFCSLLAVHKQNKKEGEEKRGTYVSTKRSKELLKEERKKPYISYLI